MHKRQARPANRRTHKGRKPGTSGQENQTSRMENPKHPHKKFILRLRMHIFRLRIYIFRLRMCILSLKIKKLHG